MEYDLEGKVALITGSSRGLGKEVAIELAKAGASVIINNRRGGEDARGVLRTIEELGKKALLAACDISDETAVSEMVANAIKHFGKIDILVNNAGISIDALTINYDADAWEKVLNANLKGPFLCSKACLPSMIEQKWGRIINIGSVAGSIGVKGTPAYSTSKAGLIGFTKTLAREVARKNITVNCLALGYIKLGGLFDTVSEELLEKILEQIPLGRWGRSEDVVNGIKFLASDAASYMTGQTIGLNGGLFM